MKHIKALVVLLVVLFPTLVFAETNTVSSTVVTDKAPPTANAPSVVVNNSDVCKSAFSVAGQASFVGLATGVTITDENCEHIYKFMEGLPVNRKHRNIAGKQS